MIKISLQFIFICLSIPLIALAEENTTPVKVQPLASLAFIKTFDVPAQALALRHSKLSSQQQGELIRFDLKVGDSLNQGETYAELDCRDHHLALKSSRQQIKLAEAALSLAEKEWKRAQTLSKGNNLSQETYNQRQTSYQQSQIELQMAKLALEQNRLSIQRCKVRAPFSGVITQSFSQLGEWLNPGTPIIEVIDLDSVEISAKVPLRLLNAFQNARDLQFSTTNHAYPVTIRSALPQINTQANNQEIRLNLSAAHQLLPGTSGRVFWESSEHYLPADYLLRREQQLGIMTFEQGTARFIALENAQEGRPFAVSLPADTLLVTDGRFAIKEGDSLSIATAQDGTITTQD